MQETIIKAVFALLQTSSALVSNDLRPAHTQLLEQSIDSLAMLAHTYAQLTQLKKNQIRPALKPEYSAICSLEESRESMFLFGDDLPKALKEAKESSQISSSIKHQSKTYKKPSWSGRRENVRSQQKDFQWSGQQKAPHPQLYKKKKAAKPLHGKEIIYILNQIKEDVSKLQQNIPLVLNYLSHSRKVFKAGQVANYLSAWSNITQDQEIIAYVQGVAVDLTEVPAQSAVPVSKFQPHEFHIVEEALSQLIEKGVIRKAPQIEGKYVLQIFLRPKADGSQRLILNLKKFNESVVYEHFKVDSIQTITKLIEKDCYMAALDLKDAYYSILNTGQKT